MLQIVARTSDTLRWPRDLLNRLKHINFRNPTQEGQLFD